jgi:hypothetical protein
MIDADFVPTGGHQIGTLSSDLVGERAPGTPLTGWPRADLGGAAS